MKNLKLHLYESGKSKPEKGVIMRFSQLKIAQKLLPVKLKESLHREGIDINVLDHPSSKNFSKGMLIEVELNQGKLIISVEWYAITILTKNSTFAIHFLFLYTRDIQKKPVHYIVISGTYILARNHRWQVTSKLSRFRPKS